jgi:hypothetical protein
MNDLDLIREFRRDVDGPSEDAKRRAAARLADAINDTPTHRPRTPVPSVRPRRIGAVLAVVLVTAAALSIFTPWKQSPGFLARAEAALTPPPSTILHLTSETTYTTKKFGCTVTRGPSEYWIDQTPPYQYRATNAFLLLFRAHQAGADPGQDVAAQRRFLCTRRTPAEIGGNTHGLLVFNPPRTLRWWGPFFPAPLDTVVALRQALAAGDARRDGETQLDGQTVERIRWTRPDCPTRPCEDNPTFAYVDPQSLYPVRIDGPGVYSTRSTPIGIDVVVRFLKYEYLPRTPANLALTSIHAQHPDATVKYP